MAISWGAWEYSGGNGMRVGIEISAVSAVSNSSTSVTWTIKIWTENQFSYGDGQTLSYGGAIDAQPNQSFTNNGGSGSSTSRDTFTHTYNYASTSYGTSPGNLTFTAALSGAYNGVTPSKSLAVAVPARPYAAPIQPSSPTHSRVSDTANKLSWVNNRTAGRPYDVQYVGRSVDGAAYSNLTTTLAGTATSFTDTGAQLGHKYFYRVAADNSIASSAYSIPATAILTRPVTPAKPTTSSPAAGEQKIDWVDTHPAGYGHQTEVWVSQDGGAYSLLATVNSGLNTYTHTSAAGSSTWAYQVRHKTTEGVQGELFSEYSPASDTVPLTSTSVPDAPTSLSPDNSASRITNSTIRLSWVHNPTDGSAQTRFTIRWRVVGGPTWTTLSEVTSANQFWDAPASTFTDNSSIEWQVSTKGADATGSSFSSSATFVTIGDPNSARAKKRAQVVDLDTGNLEVGPLGALSWVGAVTMFAGVNAPPGWLLCDGQSLSRETYANLFAIVGTTYGSVDADHFNLPNLKGRIPVGRDSGQTEFDTLGEQGGVKEVTLTAAQSGSPAHTHDGLNVAGNPLSWTANSAGTSNATIRSGAGQAVSVNANVAQNASAAHTNLQPYVVLNYIIKI